MTAPTTTVVIPLYRSSRFVPSIAANIRAMPDDVEILVSDRHLLDGAAEAIGAEFRTDHRVRVIRERDGLDWVRHADFLLHEARGAYWRYLPHDDISPAGALEALIRSLDENPQAILSYGQTIAIDSEDRRLAHKDQAQPPPKPSRRADQLDVALDLFWKGHYPGSFKGLVRRDVALDRGAGIRATRQLLHSERAWLFALRLLGPFAYVPRTTLIKRYINGSVSSGWTRTRQDIRDVTETMCGYAEDLIGDPATRCYAQDALRERMDRRLQMMKP